LEGEKPEGGRPPKNLPKFGEFWTQDKTAKELKDLYHSIVKVGPKKKPLPIFLLQCGKKPPKNRPQCSEFWTQEKTANLPIYHSIVNRKAGRRKKTGG